MSYELLLFLHVSAVALSFSLFVVRARWSILSAPQLQRRCWRILPHVIDSFLLAIGLSLMVVLRAWPQDTPWLAAKLLALLLYIGLGSVAIKYGKTPRQKALFALLAATVFVYMLAVAHYRQALFFLPA